MERCTLSRLRADLSAGGKWTHNATLAPPDGHVRPLDSKQVTELHMRPDCLHYALPDVS